MVAYAEEANIVLNKIATAWCKYSLVFHNFLSFLEIRNNLTGDCIDQIQYWLAVLSCDSSDGRSL